MISEEMYHRVYQLAQRNTDIRIIAATLHLPLRTVIGVITRIEENDNAKGKKNEKRTDAPDKFSEKPAFLDTYFVLRSRYAILQLVGQVIKATKEKLEQELQMVRLSVWKTVALQLSDVTALDETGANIIINFCKEMNSKDRYIALLDPSPHIEAAIEQFKFEGQIPIFGTVWAFEEKALSYKNAPTGFRAKNRPGR